MLLINIYRCEICKKIKFGNSYIGKYIMCEKCYNKVYNKEIKNN